MRRKRIGGSSQLRIETAADFQDLLALDEFHWMCTSAPCSQLSAPRVLLDRLDSDGNNRVMSQDIKQAIAWLRERLADWSGVEQSSDQVTPEQLRQDTPESAALKSTAETLLKRTTAPALTLACIQSRRAELTTGMSNGDGVVPPQGCQNPELAEFAQAVIDTIGGQIDATGEVGVDREALEKFVQSAQSLLEWVNQSTRHQTAHDLFPLGEQTAESYHLYEQLKPHIDEYFASCQLKRFATSLAIEIPPDLPTNGALETPEQRQLFYQQAPLAAIVSRPVLDLGSEINPEIKDLLTQAQTQIFQPLLGEQWNQNELTVEQWHKIEQIFSPFAEWLANRPWGHVEELGIARLEKLLAAGLPEQLGQRIQADQAAGPELQRLTDLEFLLLLQRWLLPLSHNFVNFQDLYDPDRQAMFETGYLIMDGRRFNLNIFVENIAEHLDYAGRSGLYLVYSEVLATPQSTAYHVVTPITRGAVAGLVKGKRGVLFAPDGEERDIRILAICPNPVNLTEAILAPFRRIFEVITESVEKLAGGAQSRLESNLSQTVSEVGTTIEQTPANLAAGTMPSAPGPEPTDTFSFGRARDLLLTGGITAAAMGSSFAFVVKTVVELGLSTILVSIAGLIAAVLLPTAIVAWTRLRARNLAVLLEASGWAINAPMRVTRRLSRQICPRGRK